MYPYIANDRKNATEKLDMKEILLLECNFDDMQSVADIIATLKYLEAVPIVMSKMTQVGVAN